MNFSLPSALLVSFFCIAYIQFLDVSMVEAAVTCGTDGVCKDSAKNGEGTVCSKCKSCTFKNCCNKIYTSEHTKCTISGWKAKGYKGDVPVDIGAPRKRDVGCSKDNHCPSGYKCVAYKKGDSKGFCWKEPAIKETFLALIAVAGLFILL